MSRALRSLALAGLLLALGASFLSASPRQDHPLVARAMDSSALLRANFTSSISYGTLALSDCSIGAVTAWYWTFGDGASSNQKDPIHEYLQPGSYLITLTVSDVGGMVSTATSTVKIETFQGAFAVLIPLVVLMLGGCLAFAVRNPYARIAIVTAVVMFILLYFAGFFSMLQVAPVKSWVA